MRSGGAPPSWLAELLAAALPHDEAQVVIAGQEFVVDRGILRSCAAVEAGQAQTGEAFGFKWRKSTTYDSETSLARIGDWLRERYGDVAGAEWWSEYRQPPLVVDAGCGAGVSAIELFGDRLRRVRYLGIEISEAVDVASTRFAERGLEGAFIQADLRRAPLPAATADVVFAEGVLHHTESTRESLGDLARLLRPGGRFMFYVYRRKGPVREFTDDYIRERLRELPPEEAWESLRPLTRLGEALGRLDVEVEVPEPVDLLGVPAGPVNVQRLLYWHFVKAFFHPDATLDEMHHVNFDWYAPRYAHRQSPEEVRSWCGECGLEIEREVVEEAGITVVARRA